MDVITALRNDPRWSFEKQSSSVTLSDSDNGDIRLWLQDGELWTKSPDERCIAAMIGLANLLEARVRGDELETYRTPTETYLHPDDRTVAKQAQQINEGYAKKVHRRKLLFRSYQIATLLALLALAVFHFLRKT